MSFALKRACLRELAKSWRQETPSISRHARRLHPLAGLGDWNALRGHAHPVTANLVPIVIEQTVRKYTFAGVLESKVLCRAGESEAMTYSRVYSGNE